MNWIDADQLIHIHDRLLQYGKGVPGMPDPDRASAICSRILNRHYYEDVNDIFELAATYLVAVARGHIFNDANKRTALMTTIIFLGNNSILLQYEGFDLEELTVGAATGEYPPERVADMLRKLAGRDE